MKLTKYEHACFTVEKNGKLLVVDPGVLTTQLAAPENVVAIVITHEHSDHFDPAALGAIIAHNPSAVIIAPASVASQVGENLPNQIAKPGDRLIVEPFELAFSGGEHAEIHDSVVHPENLAVMINQTVFYPGDSFTLPDDKPEVLALPVTAPWLRIGQVIDYLLEARPRFAFPTHDAIASPAGQAIVDNILTPQAQKADIVYQRLGTGETYDC